MTNGDEQMTARQFAEKMGVHYRTALLWLEAGLVPGATRHHSPIGDYWQIPATALSMKKPRRGPKKARRRRKPS